MTGFAARTEANAERLARPGRNCWRIARAERAGIVVDAEDYYAAIAEILPKARHSIWLVGWEFDSRTRLVRDGNGGPAIGALLDEVVRARPGLTARVLIWDSSLLYAVNREFAGLVKMEWLTHPRLHFRLDDAHPLGASHHQKILVIDDALAFVGGFDISSERWDSRAHLPDDPRRSDAAAPSFPPFHDLMAVVAGESAAALGDLCRARWQAATGLVPGPGFATDWRALWPSAVEPLFSKVDTAIARTAPAWDGEAAVREVERLYLDMIGAARRHIYIENQYFASRRIGEALARRLGAGSCPEIVVVGPGEAPSLVERSTMGVARARLHKRLVEADRYGRLRLYTPISGGRDVKVHSKLMVVDDRILRVGSANLNNRSMGLDSECDLAIEALGDPGVEAAIRRVRHDLMAEHLGTTPEAVARAERDAGGLHGAIRLLAGGPRTLLPLECTPPAQVVRLIAESDIPDPEEPMETMVAVERSMTGPAGPPLKTRLGALALVLVSLGTAAVLWPQVAPGTWRAARPLIERASDLAAEPWAWAAAVGVFILAGLVRLPVSLPVLALGMAMGMWAGTALSTAGALASALALYAAGGVLGRRRVRRVGGWRVHRVSRRLSRHGFTAIVLLRLMPVAPFTVVNLVAGAAGVRLRDFVAGTLAGMLPGIFAMSVLGDRVGAVLRRPDAVNVTVLGLAILLVVLGGAALVNRLGRVRGGRGA